MEKVIKSVQTVGLSGMKKVRSMKLRLWVCHYQFISLRHLSFYMPQ